MSEFEFKKRIKSINIKYRNEMLEFIPCMIGLFFASYFLFDELLTAEVLPLFCSSVIILTCIIFYKHLPWVVRTKKIKELNEKIENNPNLKQIESSLLLFLLQMISFSSNKKVKK